MSIRVLINGAFGQMGTMASKTIAEHDGFELLARLGREDDLAKTIASLKPDVVVDLTRADVVMANALTIIKSGARPVIGTSGLLAGQVLVLEKLCQEAGLGAVIAPNFSIGAVLMMHFANIAAGFMPHAEIIEAHHPKKQDAPSGTAVKTAELIAKGRKENISLPRSHELIAGARGAVLDDVPIHSIRLSGTLANQQVLFGAMGETLSIEHKSLDRSCFMQGIVYSCQAVMSLNHLVYGLEHLLLK